MSRRLPAEASVTDLFCHPTAHAGVRALVESAELPFRVHMQETAPRDRAGFYLQAVNDHLELCRGDDANGVWIMLEELGRRAAQGSELRRACLGRDTSSRVLDAMAGWGVDGLVLAAAGSTVTLVERHPVLWVLARDLARRSTLERVSCRLADGFEVLSGASYDVVYLDPMFPLRSKRALPGKRMQWTAELTAPDLRPLDLWLEAAIACAADRVVLKRRRKDPVVRAPDWQIVGTTVRYDVYRGTGGVPPS